MRLVAVCAHQLTTIEVINVLVDGTNIGEVDLDIGAILATQRGVALEVVAHFALESPLARCHLCGIGVERGQRVGLLHGEGRQVVDVARGDGIDG